MDYEEFLSARMMPRKEVELLRIIEDYGRIWVTTAIVNASVEYYSRDLSRSMSPAEAEQLVDGYFQGCREDNFERCVEVFGGDLTEMILFDIKRFNRLNHKIQESLAKYCETFMYPSDTGDRFDPKVCYNILHGAHARLKK